MLGRKGVFTSYKSRVVFCKKNWNAGYRSHPQPTSLLSYCTAISSRATGFSHCQNIRIVNPQLDSVWHLSYIWDTLQGRQIHMNVGNSNLFLRTHSVTGAWKRTTSRTLMGLLANIRAILQAASLNTSPTDQERCSGTHCAACMGLRWVFAEIFLLFSFLLILRIKEKFRKGGLI